MIKTKKQILKEAFAIDSSNEFTPFEVKILKKFYQLYGLDDQFDTFEASALLIEEMELDYQTAYDLVNTFLFNRRELFGEPIKLRHNTSKSELFFKYLPYFITELSNEKDSLQEIVINTLDGPEDRSISVWDLYNRFCMYISYKYNHNNLPWEEFRLLNNKNTVRVYGEFKQLYNEERNYTDSMYNEEYFNFIINQRINEETDKDEFVKEIKVPYPERITKESIKETVESMFKVVEDYVNTTTFNVNKLPGSQPEI